MHLAAGHCACDGIQLGAVLRGHVRVRGGGQRSGLRQRGSYLLGVRGIPQHFLERRRVTLGGKLLRRFFRLAGRQGQ